jgi:hypothetical protein
VKTRILSSILLTVFASAAKKSSPRFEIAGEYFEYNWYEHPGIGKVELKRKRVSQR